MVVVTKSVGCVGDPVGVGAGAPDTGVVLADVGGGPDDPVGDAVDEELDAVVVEAGGVYVCVT